MLGIGLQKKEFGQFAVKTKLVKLRTYLSALSNCSEMKNKLFEKDSNVICEMASSTITQRPANLRYCVRRNAQKSSDIR